MPSLRNVMSARLLWVSCVLIGAMATSFGAAAQETAPLAEGQWQMVTRPELDGAPMPATPRTTRFCLNPKDIQAGRIPIPMLPGCHVSGGEWSGNQLALQFSCPNFSMPVALKGTLNAAGRVFDGRIEATLEPDSTGQGKGRVAYIFMANWQQASCTTP